MDYHTKLAMIEDQALAASDSFDIGATADPDAILAGNAKTHILWLIGELRARDAQLAGVARTGQQRRPPSVPGTGDTGEPRRSHQD